ncbi:MAG TPA: CRISPR-associated protein Cas5 [bacterium]|nr:CRISPR-associated protein Cas5 [bacterium]HPN43935.1 CRISPR-associated protein Cas5 [bacterium]
MDNFLVFDWKGFFAHFRQFESNSSSLSYTFPPPTAISGMLAGLTGIQKDKYYSIYLPDKIRFGVQILADPKKIMQTCNYIYAKSPGDLNMSGDNLHTQIPVELVVSSSFPNDVLHYRIFLKISDDNLYDSLYKTITNYSFQYLPYLGSAPFTSWLEWPGDLKLLDKLEGNIISDTTVNLNLIDKKSTSLEKIDDKPPAFFVEHMRYYFKENREPGQIVDVIWERNRQKIKSSFNEPVFKFQLEKQVINVSFI